MTRQDLKPARKFLVSLIIAALIVMGAVTGLFYWKGLKNIRNIEHPDAGYYIPIEQY